MEPLTTYRKLFTLEKQKTEWHPGHEAGILQNFFAVRLVSIFVFFFFLKKVNKIIIILCITGRGIGLRSKAGPGFATKLLCEIGM